MVNCTLLLLITERIFSSKTFNRKNGEESPNTEEGGVKCRLFPYVLTV